MKPKGESVVAADEIQPRLLAGRIMKRVGYPPHRAGDMNAKGVHSSSQGCPDGEPMGLLKSRTVPAHYHD